MGSWRPETPSFRCLNYVNAVVHGLFSAMDLLCMDVVACDVGSEANEIIVTGSAFNLAGKRGFLVESEIVDYFCCHTLVLEGLSVLGP